ncbi:helicase RepA family protein [Polaromonas naphthalenivorans]|uniref:AAA ATPase n=1 Tax=Polaromonas naphthalenivorans (strain CJ2) TaxID=365044 RepID=A1VW67_POLNA|nr:helicase RepA family protein [Polaromonas naphthalenivorans]ABM39895.1 hypothetical protein Pnap_4830 [Polaromonas naphthalenivorans CJ2]
MNNSNQAAVPRYPDVWPKGQVSYLPKLVASTSSKPFGGLKTSFTSVPAATKPSSRYVILEASELRKEPVEWVLKGVFLQKGVGMIYGASGAGKSFLTLDLAAAIAEGRPWFGCRTRNAPVIYVCLEGSAGFMGRVKAWEVAHGRSLTKLMGFIFEPFSLLNPQCVHELVSAIMEFVKTVPAGLGTPVVVVDTLNRAMPGAQENGSSDMGTALQACAVISAATGGLTLLVHHTGKDADRGPRGHSSLKGALDGALLVVRSAKGRFWKSEKVKDGPDDLLFDFELEQVTLGLDADGDEVSSCVVRSTLNTAGPIKAPAMATSVKTALLSLQAVLTQTRAAANSEESCIVSLKDWREVLYTNTAAQSPSGKRNALNRALNELQGLGYVNVNGKFLEVNPAALEFLSQLSN